MHIKSIKYQNKIRCWSVYHLKSSCLPPSHTLGKPAMGIKVRCLNVAHKAVWSLLVLSAADSFFFFFLPLPAFIHSERGQVPEGTQLSLTLGLYCHLLLLPRASADPHPPLFRSQLKWHHLGKAVLVVGFSGPPGPCAQTVSPWSEAASSLCFTPTENRKLLLGRKSILFTNSISSI